MITSQRNKIATTIEEKRRDKETVTCSSSETKVAIEADHNTIRYDRRD